MIILKLAFLVLTIWFTSVNLTRAAFKQDIPSINFVLMSIAIVGFLYLQFDFLK